MNKFVSIVIFLSMALWNSAHAQGEDASTSSYKPDLKMSSSLSLKVVDDVERLPAAVAPYPTGIGGLQLGMSLEAVESLVGGETAVVSPLAKLQAPTVEIPGVYRTKVKTPLSDGPLNAVLKFDDTGTLQSMRFELPEDVYTKTLSQFSEKFGSPTNTNTRKIGSCTVDKKQDEKPGAQLSFSSATWSSSSHGNVATKAEVAAYYVDACGSKRGAKSSELHMKEFWLTFESTSSPDERFVF